MEQDLPVALLQPGSLLPTSRIAQGEQSSKNHLLLFFPDHFRAINRRLLCSDGRVEPCSSAHEKGTDHVFSRIYRGISVGALIYNCRAQPTTGARLTSLYH